MAIKFATLEFTYKYYAMSFIYLAPLYYPISLGHLILLSTHYTKAYVNLKHSDT